MTDISEVPYDIQIQFLDLARMLRARGFEHHSADAILHRIRWVDIVDRGDREFKCNNNWSAPLARWAMKVDPTIKGLFSLRKAGSDQGSLL